MPPASLLRRAAEGGAWEFSPALLAQLGQESFLRDRLFLPGVRRVYVFRTEQDIPSQFKTPHFSSGGQDAGSLFACAGPPHGGSPARSLPSSPSSAR